MENSWLHSLCLPSTSLGPFNWEGNVEIKEPKGARFPIVRLLHYKGFSLARQNSKTLRDHAQS